MKLCSPRASSPVSRAVVKSGGVYGAGSDGIDPDAVGQKRDGRGPRHGGNGSLGRMIGKVAR